MFEVLCVVNFKRTNVSRVRNEEKEREYIASRVVNTSKLLEYVHATSIEKVDARGTEFWNGGGKCLKNIM
jgi:hypothetical protein